MIGRAAGGRLSVLGVAAALGALAAAGACRSEPAPAGSTSGAAAQSSVAPYTLPPDGTASLVQSLIGRRTADGQVVVTGRLLLPESTRVWVEVYPATSASDTPLDRAELYLTSDGSFEAGPFALPAARRFRIEITSRFNRDWQPRDVLGIVGTNGTRLPRSALTPNSAQAPQAGGHLEYSAFVDIGGS